MSWALRDRVLGRRVYVSEQRVVKTFPKIPARRGDIVLVDDVRCRITRAKVTWDGMVFTTHFLRVKEAPRG